MGKQRFGEMDDFDGSRGLGIVYEVNYPSGKKTFIAPFMAKDGKTRDARFASTVAGARASITQSGGKELSDADLNVDWAIAWLKKYGGQSETATLVRNADTGQQFFPKVAQIIVTSTTPGQIPISVTTGNWWDAVWADIKKVLGIK
jgi:hypothetical protein